MLSRRLIFSCFVVFATVMLGGCLPGEEDAATRYSNLNKTAAIHNAGISLGQAANNELAYQKALRMRPTAVLGTQDVDTTSNTSSILNNPKPVVPKGVRVDVCNGTGAQNAFGAIAYFMTSPTGVANLSLTGESMAASLAEQYGFDHVGIQKASGADMPKQAAELGCPTPASGVIAVGSPIVTVGFPYRDSLLPDPNLTTDVTFTRDITIPCPTPLTGVVKRQQLCTLKSIDGAHATKELTTIQVGNRYSAETDYATNNAQRVNKEWVCSPDLKQPLPATTTAEQTAYCRDPNNNITKPVNNIQAIDISNIKQKLDTGIDGYYTFLCNTNGTGKCVATPYTPPPEVKIRCEANPVNGRFVVNPAIPLQLNGVGEVQADPAKTGTQDCGRGWRGNLTARYMVKRCNLYRKTGNTDTLIGQKQTIYHIAYAAAKCSTDVTTYAQCPTGFDQTKQLRYNVRMEMTRPVALEWSEPVGGTTQWSTSNIATTQTRTLRPEIAKEADDNGFVIPNLSTNDLNVSDNTEWSIKLADGMNSAVAGSVTKTTNCDGSACGAGTPTISPIIISFADLDVLSTKVVGGSSDFTPLICTNGTGKCHILMGEKQNSCVGPDATCTPNFAVDEIHVSGKFFMDYLVDYYNKLIKPNLPKNISVSFENVGYSANNRTYYNEPVTLCGLAGLSGRNEKRAIFAAYTKNESYTPAEKCLATRGTYTESRALAEAAFATYRSKTNQLELYSTQKGNGDYFYPGNSAYVLSFQVLAKQGQFTETISKWLQQAQNNAGTTTNACGGAGNPL
ncbi:hypothetical protein [uncultured Fibrella sp.]|uniref:hypothetical protein n=1 Tax=uncultured Fibrella sp. TaxID=1284596 RepID=UPI0035CB0BF8